MATKINKTEEEWQRELTPERLAETVGALVADPARLAALAAAARGRGRPDAVERIAERILASAAVQSR